MTAAHKTGPDRKGILYIYSQIVFYAVAIKSAIPFYPVLSRLCTISVYTRVLALFDQLKFEISRILPLLKNLTLDVTPRPPYVISRILRSAARIFHCVVLNSKIRILRRRPACVISRVLRSAARILHSVFFAVLFGRCLPGSGPELSPDSRSPARAPPLLARTLFPGSGPCSPTAPLLTVHSAFFGRCVPFAQWPQGIFGPCSFPPLGGAFPGAGFVSVFVSVVFGGVCVCLCLFPCLFVSLFLCLFLRFFLCWFLSPCVPARAPPRSPPGCCCIV